MTWITEPFVGDPCEGISDNGVKVGVPQVCRRAAPAPPVTRGAHSPPTCAVASHPDLARRSMVHTPAPSAQRRATACVGGARRRLASTSDRSSSPSTWGEREVTSRPAGDRRHWREPRRRDRLQHKIIKQDASRRPRDARLSRRACATRQRGDLGHDEACFSTSCSGDPSSPTRTRLPPHLDKHRPGLAAGVTGGRSISVGR